jgi:hypothetical protein
MNQEYPRKCALCGEPEPVDELEKKSHETWTHVECLKTGKCQETEGFKGTEHEGLDMCEDGCVWYKPPGKQLRLDIKSPPKPGELL